jgi:hypothetical protein
MKARRVFGLAVLAAALCFVVLIIMGTTESRAYFREHRPQIPQGPYPVGPVAVSCAMVVIEAFAFWRLLTAGRSSLPIRALIAFGASFAGAFILGMNLMHAPPRVSYHFLWLLCVAALALGTCLISAGDALVRPR